MQRTSVSEFGEQSERHGDAWPCPPGSARCELRTLAKGTSDRLARRRKPTRVSRPGIHQPCRSQVAKQTPDLLAAHTAEPAAAMSATLVRPSTSARVAPARSIEQRHPLWVQQRHLATDLFVG